MKRLKLLRRIMRESGARKYWLAFLLLFFACALVIWLREPGIATYRQALWYCYAVVTTIGFGDVVAQYPISRILSALLSISAVLVIALVTGVLVNYYTQITALRHKETLAAFMDKLERLPELSHEELAELSEKVRRFELK